jgi:hypothetical protein
MFGPMKAVAACPSARVRSLVSGSAMPNDQRAARSDTTALAEAFADDHVIPAH